MNTKAIALYLAIILGFVLPAMLFSNVDKRPVAMDPKIDPTEQETVTQSYVRVKMSDGTVTEMEEEKYILGVVLQEMPVNFEKEALKAQAVVARTYARRKKNVSGKHADADICTDPACCQGFCPSDMYAEKGFKEADIHKVRTSVAETSGQVLTYNGMLIDATYFSCSGGMTEDAFAVWGTDVPYLQATESPGEESAAHYSETVQFTVEAFQKALGIKLQGASETWISAIKHTEGDGVLSVEIGGIEFTGVQLRKLLNLRSTSFTINAIGTNVIITTKGFGHRVGMSQYGAEAMAVNGKGYREILAHYYHGTQLEETGE